MDRCRWRGANHAGLACRAVRPAADQLDADDGCTGCHPGYADPADQPAAAGASTARTAGCETGRSAAAPVQVEAPPQVEQAELAFKRAEREREAEQQRKQQLERRRQSNAAVTNSSVGSASVWPSRHGWTRSARPEPRQRPVPKRPSVPGRRLPPKQPAASTCRSPEAAGLSAARVGFGTAGRLHGELYGGRSGDGYVRPRWSATAIRCSSVHR